ncbi:MAG TPA: nucleoside deaminase [Pseudonocardiaceae bacterium]
MTPADATAYVLAAVEAAQPAIATGDIPVGAVVYSPSGVLLSSACNAREALGDPTAHAEIIALRTAATELGDGWRLADCTLAVTVEPCTMCAGAAVLSRVGRIVFGSWEPRTGAVGSLWDVVRDRRLNHRPEVLGPDTLPDAVVAACARLLSDFFTDHR